LGSRSDRPGARLGSGTAALLSPPDPIARQHRGRQSVRAAGPARSGLLCSSRCSRQSELWRRVPQLTVVGASPVEEVRSSNHAASKSTTPLNLRRGCARPTGRANQSPDSTFINRIYGGFRAMSNFFHIRNLGNSLSQAEWPRSRARASSSYTQSIGFIGRPALRYLSLLRTPAGSGRIIRPQSSNAFYSC
jgi:hypothetical protein